MLTRLFQERGTAILIVMALIAMLTAVGIMSVDRATLDIDLSFNQLSEEQAFYVAEAGLQHGLAELNKDFTWRTGVNTFPVGDGFYIVTVVDSITDTMLADTVVLRSRAVVNSAAAAVEGYIVQSPPIPIFKYALFAGDSLRMDQNSCTDSYNADSGTYAATVDTLGGDIGSNGFVDLQGGAVVGGDASTNGDTIIIRGGSTVLGDTTSSADEFPMDLISQSEYNWAEANSAAPSGFIGSGYTYNSITHDLTLGSGDELTLSSGVYFFNNVTLGQSSNIKIDSGAEVTIYLTGDFVAGQNSTVNANGNPSDLLIYSTGDYLTLDQSVEFRAGFYGPNTTFTISQNTNLYGSIVAASVLLKQGSCIHYDRDLVEIIRDQPNKVAMVAWRQI